MSMLNAFMILTINLNWISAIMWDEAAPYNIGAVIILSVMAIINHFLEVHKVQTSC